MNTGLKTWTKRVVVFLVTAAMALTLIPFTGLKTVTKAAAGDIPATAKLLADNGDGTYKLALSVTGESEKIPVTTNVVVILDVSGSMNYPSENVSATGRYGYNPSNNTYRTLYRNTGGNNYSEITNNTTSGTVYYRNNNNYIQYTGPRYTSNSANVEKRMQAAKDAVNGLAEALLSHNGADGNPPDTFEMALVSFSTHATISRGPTTSYNTGNNSFKSAVDGLSATGGTNWEAALQTAASVDFEDNDQTFVIFVSDGNPTFRQTRGDYNPMDDYYYNTAGYGVYGNGSDSQAVNGMPAATTIARCYEHAVDDAQTLANDIGKNNFYTIGAFGDVDRMQTLTSAVGAPSAN